MTKWIWLIIITVFITLLHDQHLFSAEKLRVAVMNFSEKGVSKTVASAVTNIVHSTIVNSGKFTVIEREQMKAILEEQGFQQTGCTDAECAVKVGKLLSVQKILVGDVNRVGTLHVITARLVDVESGSSEFSAMEKAETERDLEKASVAAARKMIEEIEEAVAVKYSPYYLRGIVPGWGQHYAGNKLRGWVMAGTFAAAAVFTAYSYYDYTKKKDDYDGLDRYTASREDFDDAYDRYDRAGKTFNYSLALLGLVYAVNWADILFFSKGDYTRKMEKGTAMLGPGPRFYFAEKREVYETQYQLGMELRF